MASVRRPHSYDEPFGWWGPLWSPPDPRPLANLIEESVLTAECAALLGLLIERRASVIVAAGPSGAGKSTLLTALLDFLPAESRRIYIRGCYEPFDFLGVTDPQTSALLVNELSPHLPIYLWGSGVRRALQAVQTGYQLLGTAHATSVDEFVYSLAGYPLRVPALEIAALDLLVLLDVWREGDMVRREVRAVVNLAAGTEPASLSPIHLAERSQCGEPLRLHLDATHDLYRRLGGDPSKLQQDVEIRALGLIASNNTDRCG